MSSLVFAVIGPDGHIVPGSVGDRSCAEAWRDWAADSRPGSYRVVSGGSREEVEMGQHAALTCVKVFDDRSDPSFWPTVGPLATSRRIVMEVGDGAAVFDSVDKVWLVATVADEFAGFATAEYREINGCAEVLLSEAWVEPALRGHGILRALFDAGKSYVTKRWAGVPLRCHSVAPAVMKLLEEVNMVETAPGRWDTRH